MKSTTRSSFYAAVAAPAACRRTVGAPGRSRPPVLADTRDLLLRLLQTIILLPALLLRSVIRVSIGFGWACWSATVRSH